MRASVLPRGHLPEADAARVVSRLADAGFQKINFAGGEPTLCKWLHPLIRTAKQRGLTTSIVTNGSYLTLEWLMGAQESLDWIALSVDTLNPLIAKRLGRVVRGQALSQDYYLNLSTAIRESRIKLKLNTVVTRLNVSEDMKDFVFKASPERWKIFQVLPVTGQNDGRVDDLLISHDDFLAFVNAHESVKKHGVEVVAETNEAMTGSYVMVDPAGRFFDNTTGRHRYSRPILEIGVERALDDIDIYPERFLARNGVYSW